jgi:hypothetical protein
MPDIRKPPALRGIHYPFTLLRGALLSPRPVPAVAIPAYIPKCSPHWISPTAECPENKDAPGYLDSPLSGSQKRNALADRTVQDARIAGFPLVGREKE